MPDLGQLRIDLLLRNHARFEKLLIPIVVNLHVAQLRLILRELPFGLFELHLIWSRIDLDERLALVNHLPFGEIDLDDLAVHAAADGNGVVGGDGTQPVEKDRQVAARRRRNNDRHNLIGIEAAVTRPTVAARRTAQSLRQRRCPLRCGNTNTSNQAQRRRPKSRSTRARPIAAAHGQSPPGGQGTPAAPWISNDPFHLSCGTHG